MAERAYDVIVIGSGPGGYVAAIRAAQLGMSTAVVEKGDVGGRCLNVACIPAKAVLRVADIMGEVSEAAEFGIEVNGSSVDFAKVGERERILPNEDADISKAAAKALAEQSITIHAGYPRRQRRLKRVLGDFRAIRRHLGGSRLCRHRRRPRTRRRGTWPDEAGVKLDEQGLIAVDAAQRTSLNGVYAIGDLVRGPALAHKASDEGLIAVEDAAGMPTHGLEYVDIPRATFCTPNVASFGLTEEQAREPGYDVTVGKINYGTVGGGTVYGARTRIIKIIGDKQYGELIGGHIVGAKATDLIQELVNARALEGGYHEVARPASSTGTRRCPKASWKRRAPPMAGSSTAEEPLPRAIRCCVGPDRRAT